MTVACAAPAGRWVALARGVGLGVIQVQRWLEIGFRSGGASAPNAGHCGGLPSARRCNEEPGTAAIELSIDPRGCAIEDLQVDWGRLAQASWCRGRSEA